MFSKWSRQNVLLNSTPRGSNLTAQTIQYGTVVVRSGEYTRCGRKHDHNEDRVCTSTGLYATSSSSSRSNDSSSASRESEDQQLICIADMLKQLPGEHYDADRLFLSAVTDGHGGHHTSQFVSHNILACIARQAEQKKTAAGGGCGRVADLATAVMDGFKACEDLLDVTHPSENSGCCCLVTVVSENYGIIAHVGDVRAVLYECGEIKQLSRDHRATDESEAMRITQLGGHIANNRVHGVLAPSRAFGNSDLKNLVPAHVLSSEPELVRFEVDEAKIRKSAAAAAAGWCFLIAASDGVWDCMTNEQACDLVAKTLKSTNGLAAVAAKRLVEAASKKNDDDVTVNVLVWAIEDEDDLEETDKA